MADAGRKFLGRGWAFPFAIEPDRGRVELSAYEADIKQSIYIILATSKGERQMRPDFGCGIHDLVFAAIDTGLIAQIKRDVEEALRTYEARIEVLLVSVDPTNHVNGRLDVSIDYQIRLTNQSGNLVYPFYFKELT